MNRIFRNAFGALRLDRQTYDRLFFDDYATADAVLIVVAVSAMRLLAAIVLGNLAVLGLIQGLIQITINELIRWMVAALIMWVVSTKLLGGIGRIPATVGLVGYAYLPFILVPVVELALGIAGLGVFSFLAEVGASIWMGFGLMIVGTGLFSLPRDRAVIASVLSVIGWWLVTALLGF